MKMYKIRFHGNLGGEKRPGITHWKIKYYIKGLKYLIVMNFETYRPDHYTKVNLAYFNLG